MSPLPPDECPADLLPPAPQPVVPAGSQGITDVLRPPGVMPWERRQPQVQRRSVLPVEWFRRMPGGGTTYAPGDAGAPADAVAGNRPDDLG